MKKYTILDKNNQIYAKNVDISVVFNKYLPLIGLGIGYRCVDNFGNSTLIRSMFDSQGNLVYVNLFERHHHYLDSGSYNKYYESDDVDMLVEEL